MIPAFVLETSFYPSASHGTSHDTSTASLQATLCRCGYARQSSSTWPPSPKHEPLEWVLMFYESTFEDQCLDASAASGEQICNTRKRRRYGSFLPDRCQIAPFDV